MYVINNIGIASLDTRSERSLNCCLSPSVLSCLDTWLAGQTDLEHLIVLLSVPPVWHDYREVTRKAQIMDVVIADDYADTWRTDGHSAEREELFLKFLNWANANKSRVTLVTGDVHAGGVGVVVHDKFSAVHNSGYMTCLISSPVLNNAEVGIFPYLWKRGGAVVEHLDWGHTGLCRLPQSETDNDLYILHRHYLSLCFMEDYGLDVEWWIENLGEKPEDTKPTSRRFFLQPYKANAAPDITAYDIPARERKLLLVRQKFGFQ